MGPANDRVGALGINGIACGLVSALNHIHEPQFLRFNSQLTR
jgi:hypothetical protein